jgi:hypothetical protein
LKANRVRFQFCDPSLAILARARTRHAEEEDEELDDDVNDEDDDELAVIPSCVDATAPLYFICISYVSPGQSLEKPISSFFIKLFS